ncbi:MAG: alpha-ketoacid dehydrogenase subunit beta [Planctomycetes bacterium]|nr:alpha-ketoacid dehydrogenase subunit beta [Planctomycetota bacterium]
MRYAESLNRSLLRLLAEDPRVYLIGEDLKDPYGGAFKVTRGASTGFPGRVLSMPISEAGFTGLAIGMSLRGLKPIVELMFGDFAALCADQIVNHAAKFAWMYNDQVSVPLILRMPSGGGRGYGPTHSQCLESLFYNVPLLEIVSPSLYHDPGAILRDLSLSLKGPLLFVENKLAYSKELVEGGERISLGDARTPTMSFGFGNAGAPEVLLIAYGGSAAVAMAAAAELQGEDLSSQVLIPSRIKPLPLEDLLGAAASARLVVTIEETPKTHGWGAEVSARLNEQGRLFPKKILRIGAAESPIPNALHLEKQVLPGVESVVREIAGALLGA